MLLGVLYGIFYYKKEITWKRVALATTVITLLESLIFTPIWLTLMYKVPFWGLMPIRFGKALILIPIQIIVVHFVLKRLQATPVFKKLTKDSD
jgi:ECF transporter S component (folate family)